MAWWRRSRSQFLRCADERHAPLPAADTYWSGAAGEPDNLARRMRVIVMKHTTAHKSVLVNELHEVTALHLYRLSHPWASYKFQKSLAENIVYVSPFVY